jgi:hypothetical protein
MRSKIASKILSALPPEVREKVRAYANKQVMKTTEPQNLMDGLFEQMNRCREVLTYYDEIPQGVFGATMIRASIRNAENAIKENDVIKMLAAYRDLKEIE